MSRQFKSFTNCIFRLVEALLGLVFPAPSTTTTTTEPTTTTTTTTAAPCGGVLGTYYF